MRRLAACLLVVLGVATDLLGAGAVAQAADTCAAPRISPQRMAAVRRQWNDRTSYREPTVAVLRYRFTTADGPPTVDILFAAGSERLAEIMAEEAKDLRAPCVASAGPVQAYQYERVSVYSRGESLTEAERRLQEDLALTDLVRIVKDVKSQKVRFDFGEMNCPFVVSFAPFQPYAPNDVRETGERVPARAPFLGWLRTLALDIPKDMMGTAIGQRSRILVPCAVLDLS